MVCHDRGAGEHGDDVAGTGASGIDAKKKTTVAREQDQEERAAWRTEAIALDPAVLVFLDETSTPTTLTPLMARSPRGQRAIGIVPLGRREQVSLLATLTPNGFGAALSIPGAINRNAFDSFIIKMLIPTLRQGQIVLCDNLPVHKRARAREALEAAGCTLRFLPRYSPDFNPIEQAFAKLKQNLRRASARTIDTVIDATGVAMTTVTANDARAFFADAGFALPSGQNL